MSPTLFKQCVWLIVTHYAPEMEHSKQPSHTNKTQPHLLTERQGLPPIGHFRVALNLITKAGLNENLVLFACE